MLLITSASLLLPAALVQEKGPYFPRSSTNQILEILRKMLQPIPEDLQFKKSETEREKRMTMGKCWSLRQTVVLGLWQSSCYKVIKHGANN